MLGLGIGIVPSDRLFSLNDISNLELYLKNYVGINLDSGGAGGVESWDDSSGNARHATQGTVNLQAQTLDDAGNATGGLNFEATDPEDFYNFSEIAVAEEQGFTIFMVCDPETDASNRAIISNGVGDNSFIEYRNGNSVRFRLNAASLIDVLPVATDSFAKEKGKFLCTITRNAGSAGEINLWANGVALTLQAEYTMPDECTFDALGVRSDDRYFDGVIHEFAFYGKTLSAYELADVHAYLKSKHRL